MSLRTSSDVACRKALLLAYWSVRQKLNHVSSVQLRRSVRAFKADQCDVFLSLCPVNRS